MWRGTFQSAKLVSNKPRKKLLRLLAGFLDDLRREFALRRDEAREFVGALQRWLDAALNIDALAEARLGHDAVGVGSDLVDDRPRHAGRREQAEPGRRIV